MKMCSKCGYENVDEAKFCKNCGFKLQSALVSDNNQNNDVNVAVNINQDSIISKLFYKTDKYTGQFRFAKLKSITIIVFVFMFLWAVSVNLGHFPLISVILAAAFIGLAFAVPTFIIGYALSWLIDRFCL